MRYLMDAKLVLIKKALNAQRCFSILNSLGIVYPASNTLALTQS